MPYRKRRFKRRMPRNSFATRVRRVISKDKESKSTQVASFSGTGITTGTTSYMCNDIDTGDTKATRDGEQIFTRAIGGRFTIGHNAAGGVGQVLRVVLYRPRQLDNLPSSLSYTDYIDPSENIVLYDKLFHVSAEKPVVVCNLGYKFYSKKFPQGLKTTYSSGVGTDIQTGPVYVALVSDQATNGPTLNGYIRCFFKDK